MLNYKCLQCSAPIEYQPGTETAVCPYCGGKFTIAELEAFAQKEAAKEKAAQKSSKAPRPGQAGYNPSGGPGSGSTQAPTGVLQEFPQMAGGQAGAASAAGTAGQRGQVTGGPGREAAERKTPETMSSADYLSQEPDRKVGEDMSDSVTVYHCNNCGADIVADPSTAASYCYYCHSPVILTNNLDNEFRPAKIIPFRVDKEKVVDLIKEKVAKKFFVPKSFSSESQMDAIKGVYLPFWDFKGYADVNVNVSYEKSGARYRSGDNYYKKVTTYNRVFQGPMVVDDYSAYASKKIKDIEVDTVNNFNPAEKKEFSSAYLSGFFAENYDLTPPELEAKVKQKIVNEASDQIAEALSGGENIKYLTKIIVPYINSAELVLKPMYIMTYRYLGKIYTYTINGQNLEFFGEFPLDKGKLAVVSGIIGLVTFIIVMVLVWYFAL